MSNGDDSGDGSGYGSGYGYCYGSGYGDCSDKRMDMKQQPEPTPAQRIAAGIDAIQRGINDMDRAGVAAQALSEIDQCLAWLRSAFDDLPESIVTHEKARCDGCQYYMRDEQQLPVGDGTATEVSYWCEVPTTDECPAVRACGFEEVKRTG